MDQGTPPSVQYSARATILPSAEKMTERSRRTPAIAAVSIAGLILAAAALANLRDITRPSTVDIAVPTSAWAIEGSVARASVRDGLPSYVLHWDGQPPTAILIDADRGLVLAPPALSDDTFARNQNAVRFSADAAHVKLDARQFRPDTNVALRVEAVRPRLWFHLLALSAVFCGVVLVVLLGARASDAMVLAIAALVFAATYPGAPVRISDSNDEANINSFAAGLDHPEWFTYDKLLSIQENFSWYVPFYVALVRLVGVLGFHYGTTYAFLGAAIVVLLFFGLQRLFSAVSGSRGFGIAAAFALGLMWDQQLPAGEEWVLVSPLPRALFTALLPWILLLALRCAPSSRRWWVATLAAGLAAHIYPLSAPVLLGALIVGFVVASDEPFSARLRGAIIASGAAVLAMAPYVVVYSERYASGAGSNPEMAARVRDITLLGYVHLEPAHVLEQLVRHRVGTLRVGLDLLALTLLVWSGFNRSTRLLIGLFAGFVLLTFVLPIADGAIARELGRRPYQIEMVRAVRYLDLFVAGALAIAVRQWRGSPQRARLFVATGAVLTVLALGTGWATTTRAVLGRARLDWRLLHNRPDAASAAAQEAIRVVQAVHLPDERVAGPVGLRQYGVPLAWTWKDVLLLAYASAPALLDAAAAHQRAQALLTHPITPESLRDLSGVLDAQLFLIPRAQVDETLARSECVLFENDAYVVARAD